MPLTLTSKRHANPVTAPDLSMIPEVLTLPWWAMPPGTAGPTPRGIYCDPATSWRMTKTLLKGMSPQLKVRHKGHRKAHKAVPHQLTVKR